MTAQQTQAPIKPEEVLQPTIQTEVLHQEISGQLNQIGHKTIPSTVNPDDQTPLENIKKTVEEATGDAVHVVGTAGTMFGGEEHDTYIRTAPGHKFLSLAKQRLQRLFKKRA